MKITDNKLGAPVAENNNAEISEDEDIDCNVRNQYNPNGSQQEPITSRTFLYAEISEDEDNDCNVRNQYNPNGSQQEPITNRTFLYGRHIMASVPRIIGLENVSKYHLLLNWKTLAIPLICALMVACVSMRLYYISPSASDETVSVETVSAEIRMNDFKYSHFHTQDADVKAGIISGLNMHLSGSSSIIVFTLLYNGDANKANAECLAYIIADVVNRRVLKNSALGGSSALIRGDKFLFYDKGSSDYQYGAFLDTIANIVANERILLTTDLHRIPAYLSMAFHFLCDEYNPNVRDVVYIFTVDAESSWSQHQQPDEIGEQALRTAWHNLTDDAFYPLIARILSISLPIAKVQEETCPLKWSDTIEITPSML